MTVKEIQGKLQQFAGAMMVPIILLVCVGMYVGIGSAFTNYLIPKGTVAWRIADLFVGLGFKMMNTLPMWFALGLAFTLSRKEKGWGAFNGAVLFFMTHTVISRWATSGGITKDSVKVDQLIASGLDPVAAANYSALWTDFMGIFTLDAGIFSGLATGLLAAWIHNKMINVKVPTMLSFFGGPRLGVLVSTLVAIPLGLVFFYAWPIVAGGLQGLTHFITASGLFGTWLFGALDKMLLPFGLHHLIAFPIEYTSVGGTMTIDGTTFEGVRNIMTGQAGSATATGYITRNFTTGRLLFMFGGIPGMALAMYRTAHAESKQRVAALLVPAVLTAIVVGVTEPFEFTFAYVAPGIYWLVYAPLCGLAYVVMEAMHVSIIGQGGIFLLPNLFQPQKVHAWPLLLMIPVFFALYYFIFKGLIVKFNVKTPGRGGIDEEIRFTSKEEVRSKYADAGVSTPATTLPAEETGKGSVALPLAQRIVASLGGADNIDAVTNCATRLRVTVKDPKCVAADAVWQGENEATAVVRSGQNLQIIYGPRVISLVGDVKECLGID